MLQDDHGRAAEGTPSTQSSKSVAKVIGLCFAVSLAEGYDTAAMGVAAPVMARELGLQADKMGIAFSAALIGMMVGGIVGGYLADRVGRKVILTGAIAMLGASSWFTALVGSFDMIALSRLLTGIALGAGLPCVIALSSEAAPKNRRGTLLTLMFMGYPLGTMVVAVTSSVIIGRLGWQSIFFIGGAMPALLLPLTIWALPPNAVGPRTERRARSLSQSLFKTQSSLATSLLGAASAINQLIFYLVMNWLPLLLVQRGITASLAPMASLAFGVGNLFGAPVVGVLLDRFGTRMPLVAMFIVLPLAILGLAHFKVFGGILVFSALIGFFGVGAQIGIYSISPFYYPTLGRGFGVGTVLTIGRIGAIVGPLLAGYALLGGTSGSVVLTYLAVIAPLAALAMFFLPPPLADI